MDLASWGVTASDQVTGLDIDAERLALAKVRFPNRTYQQGTGECLPFKEENFDRVISTVALPYMNIQKTLAEDTPRPGSWRRRHGKRVIVPLHRQDCRVPQREDGIVSDRARNEDRTESGWIRQSFIPPGNWAGWRNVHCGSKKTQSDRCLGRG